jgi:hypothetical protein
MAAHKRLQAPPRHDEHWKQRSKQTQLTDTMLIVTNDGTMETYSGGGRHLAIAYRGILQAMEAPPATPRPAVEQARIDVARAVLWEADGQPSAKYALYQKNQLAFAAQRAAFTIAQNKA